MCLMDDLTCSYNILLTHTLNPFLYLTFPPPMSLNNTNVYQTIDPEETISWFFISTTTTKLQITTPSTIFFSHSFLRPPLS
ncbi:hypothetical protein V6Z11_D01G241900 [Gossypium hirsutum]